MNKTTLIIYGIIVGVAILSSILKKKKKTGNTYQNQQKKTFTNTNQQTTTQQYKKPATTQPKSLEDILQSLLGEQKTQPTFQPKQEEKMVFTDKDPKKYTTLEEVESYEELEKEETQYYSYDTELDYKEEIVDYDKTTDHRVHGAGFDDIMEEVQVEEVSEWQDIDWRKAIITAEILKRPEY